LMMAILGFLWGLLRRANHRDHGADERAQRVL
jgi:hypothetical protein